jgi:hypothetical protein
MLKSATATALAITLTITMLTPAVSGPSVPLLNEGQCEILRPDWPKKAIYAIRCHCEFECRRQHSYTVRMPCSPDMPGYVSGMKGLCERRLDPIETVHACLKTCVKEKEATRR